MRNCRPIQIAVLLLCGALTCAAQGPAVIAAGGKVYSRRFATGLALLVNHQCGLAAADFEVQRSLPEAAILLGLAYDCADERVKLDAAFQHSWDLDLDPQETSAEAALVQKSGFVPQPRTARGKYFAALLNYRMGNYDAAMTDLHAASPPVAGSWAFYNLLGSIYLRESHFAEAKQALEAALVRDGKGADTFYKLGTVALATGDVASATEKLKQAVRLRPSFPAAHAALGIAMLQAGDYAAARETLEKGTAAGPEIYVYLGAANEHLGDRKAAMENYRNALSRQPLMFAAEFPLGRLLLASGDYAGAITHLQKAAQLDPSSAQAQLYLAMVLVAAKQPENAGMVAEKAMAAGRSEGPDFQDALGSVWLDSGKADRAVESFKRAMAADAANENYVRHLAAAQHKAGDSAGAIATLRAGILHVPESARLNYLLGISLMANGSSAEALPALRKAAQLEPADPDYQQSLGLGLAETEQDEEAMSVFRRVLALDSKHAPAYLQIGILQLKTRPEDAEQSFKKAVEIDTEYAPAYFRLGKIFYDRNDDVQALKYLEKTRALDPDWEDTYFLLGTLYKRAGDEDQSAEMFAIFRKKKNELQDLRRKTFDLAPDAFDDARPVAKAR